jgi:hypothetical protein
MHWIRFEFCCASILYACRVLAGQLLYKSDLSSPLLRYVILRDMVKIHLISEIRFLSAVHHVLYIIG